MNTGVKRKIKEWVGVCSATATLAFSVLGIASLHSYITPWGSLSILLLLVISYKYV